ncbi:hypothetical protein BDK51DRAFT_36724 [Blyttiomyces helicus]|uniref:Uncharacterized protein n=1 Tax=Blyttiomyces helicus TaxID=388810 RepID=A0A4P9WJ68_9FUNG|nr:hypothetical protein BDK51DRAFT_36724 [Blyttiomyces helicus]|eukprot:RKO91180.1 hypothetical protein BDK51DRAFT_36724 [Blyttiomyces helicus]
MQRCSAVQGELKTLDQILQSVVDFCSLIRDAYCMEPFETLICLLTPDVVLVVSLELFEVRTQNPVWITSDLVSNAWTRQVMHVSASSLSQSIKFTNPSSPTPFLSQQAHQHSPPPPPHPHSIMKFTTLILAAVALTAMSVSASPVPTSNQVVSLERRVKKHTGPGILTIKKRSPAPSPKKNAKAKKLAIGRIEVVVGLKKTASALQDVTAANAG